MTYELAMYAGMPTDIDNYELVEVNGLRVYLSKKAKVAPEGVSIAISGRSIWRRLNVQGLLA